MLKFAHDIAGGQGNLIVTSLQSPNFESGIEGWQVAKDGSSEFQNVTIRGTFFGLDFEINSAGAFFYSSTPAAGNLFIAIANSNGNDRFGNAYFEGIALFQPNGQSIFIGPDAGIPIIQFTPASTTHLNIPPQIFASSLAAGTNAEQQALALASGSETGSNNQSAQMVMVSESFDGTLPAVFQIGAGLVVLRLKGNTATLETAGGIFGQLPITQTDISNHSANTTSNLPITTAWSIPAGDMQVGTVYRISSGGTGLWGTAQTLQAVGNLNGNNETGGGAAGRIAGAFLANATAFNWSAVYEFKVITTGTGGTARVRLTFTISSEGSALTPGTAAQNSMSVVTGPQAGAISVNTTIANTLGIGAAWGGTTGSPTIGGADSTFERLGP